MSETVDAERPLGHHFGIRMTQGQMAASTLPRAFHGNGEPLYLFVLTQFRTENRFTLFLELL